MYVKIERVIYAMCAMTQSSYYDAGVIIEEPDQPVFRKSGYVRIKGQKIVFEAEGKAVDMPVHGCHISLGGTANKQAYVTHKQRPDITLQINDFRLFKEPVFDGHQEATKFKLHQNTHHGLLISSLLVMAFVLLVPFYMIFIERDFLVSTVTDAVPPRYDIKIGDMAFGSGMGAMIEDPEILGELKRITAPLINAASEEPFEYNLHIAKSDVVNAFAVPGGHIIINSGLIEKTSTPEELLGVVAHEIAHINERHSMKRIMHGVSSWVFMSLLGADPNHVVALLSDQAQMLSSRSYSRYHENEADSEGFRYMIEAGIDPRGLQGFFELLQEEESALSDNEVFGLLSTHPLTDDRIDALNEMMDNLNRANQAFQPVPIDYDAFKANVKQAADSESSSSETSP